MASIFITREPVKGDIQTKNNPNVLYIQSEYERCSASESLRREHDALRQASVADGDTVYVTVAYSDGGLKPGNIRNSPRRVKYGTIDGTPYAELAPILK